MPRVYHLNVSGSIENQKYRSAIAKIIKAYFSADTPAFDVRLSDGESVLFKSEEEGKSFTARKDLLPILFNASANVESENVKEEKSSDAKPLTEEEKKLFGKPYTNDVGTVYYIGDFVRATAEGYCYHCDDVGIVVGTDSEDPAAPLLIYFAAYGNECWVPCKDFEKIYWS